MPLEAIGSLLPWHLPNVSTSVLCRQNLGPAAWRKSNELPCNSFIQVDDYFRRERAVSWANETGLGAGTNGRDCGKRDGPVRGRPQGRANFARVKGLECRFRRARPVLHQ